MTICLKRWKIHVRVSGWRVFINRGGICMCDIVAILGQCDDRWWRRWWAKLRTWSYNKFGITI